MSSDSSSAPISPQLRAKLQDLFGKISGSTLAMRIWQDPELMTPEDHNRLRDEVEKEPWNPGKDEVEEPDEDGKPRRRPADLVQRCYQRWGTVGMWMRAKKMRQPAAIVDLAYQLGMLLEPEHRRLLQGLGKRKKRPGQTKLPSWDKEQRVLRFERGIARKIKSVKVASNIVPILDAFEQQKWPPHIDTPEVLSGQKLHDAVYSLNQDLKNLAFHVTGDGARITWGRH